MQRKTTDCISFMQAMLSINKGMNKHDYYKIKTTG